MPEAQAQANAQTPVWQTDVEGVGDPSDWIGSDFSFVKDLDASLRCEICADILRAPVSIKTCFHIFCSRCIRDYINQPSISGAPTERPCPNCRQPKVYDSELVPVGPLELAAEAWRKVRSLLVEKEAEYGRRSATKASSPTGASHKRRRLDGDQQVVIPSDVTSYKGPSSRRVTRNSTFKAINPVYRQSPECERHFADPIVVEDDSEDTDWTPAGESSRPSLPKVGHQKSPVKANGSPATCKKSLKDISASDVVECPLCQHTFTLQALNRHLDNPAACKGPEGPPPSDRERGLTSGSTSMVSSTGKFDCWFSRSNSGSGGSSSSKGSNSKVASGSKLKRPQYQLLSDKALRKLCDDCGLATTGSKLLLEARHRRWVDAFNANLDSSPAYRRSEGQLRRDMREWDREREREEYSNNLKSGPLRGTGPSVMAPQHATNGHSTARNCGNKGVGVVGASEEERRLYVVSHADHFRQLVAQSRHTHLLDKKAHAAAEVSGEKAQGEDYTFSEYLLPVSSPATFATTDSNGNALNNPQQPDVAKDSLDMGEVESINWSKVPDGEEGREEARGG